MSTPNLEYTDPTEEIVPTWTLTNGTPADGYLTASLTDDNPANPYKVASPYLRLVGDAGAPVTPALAVLIHPNFDPGLAPIYLQGGTSFASVSSGGAPFSVPWPLPSYYPDAFPLNLALDLRGLGPHTYQYWSLVTGDGAGGSPNSVPIAIGEFKLYADVHALEGSLTLTLSPRMDEGYPLIDHTTDGDVNLIYPIGTKRRSLRGGLIQSEANAVALQRWWQAAKGRSTPFTILVSPAEGTLAEPWFVRFESVTLSRDLTYGQTVSTFQIGFEEISRGLRPTPAAV